MCMLTTRHWWTITSHGERRLLQGCRGDLQSNAAVCTLWQLRLRDQGLSLLAEWQEGRQACKNSHTSNNTQGYEWFAQHRIMLWLVVKCGEMIRLNWRPVWDWDMSYPRIVCRKIGQWNNVSSRSSFVCVSYSDFMLGIFMYLWSGLHVSWYLSFVCLCGFQDCNNRHAPFPGQMS